MSDPGSARAQLAQALMTDKETLAPVFDAADGIRADLTGRGWSQKSAEAAALTWLQGFLAVWTGQQR